MKKEWENVIITKINSAVYVPEGKGNQMHVSDENMKKEDLIKYQVFLKNLIQKIVG